MRAFTDWRNAKAHCLPCHAGGGVLEGAAGVARQPGDQEAATWSLVIPAP